MYAASSRERGALAETVQLPQAWFAVFLDLAGAFTLVRVYYTGLPFAECNVWMAMTDTHNRTPHTRAKKLQLVELLAVPESVLACGGAIASVLLYRAYAPALAINLTWVAVSIMLVFPITSSITSAFTRREGAIRALGDFRSHLANIYQAHATWDWGGAGGWGGRSRSLDASHLFHVRSLLLALIDRVEELLLVPRRGRMRHIHTSYGKSELRQVIEAETRGRRHVTRLMGRLHLATEALKQAGLPANEASRINAYVCQLTCAFERLWGFKVYRTSVALRGMAHITIQLMPAFYGPYYLYMSRSLDGDDNIVFACAFACLISCLLVSLQSLERLLENPFRDRATDCIRVKEEMQLCRQALLIAQRDLTKVWYEDLDEEDNVGDEVVVGEAIVPADTSAQASDTATARAVSPTPSEEGAAVRLAVRDALPVI